MSNINNKKKLKDLSALYKITYQKAEEILRIIINIPFMNIRDLNDIKIINNISTLLYNFLNKKEIRIKDINQINQILSALTIDNIFDSFLMKIEKDLGDKEYEKYLKDPTNYRIPNFEIFLENGEFLKLYIEHKIGSNNEKKEEKHINRKTIR